MSPEQISALADDVRYIRERVDEQGATLSDLRVSVAQVKERAGWIGAITGIVGGLLAGIGIHLKDR